MASIESMLRLSVGEDEAVRSNLGHPHSDDKPHKMSVAEEFLRRQTLRQLLLYRRPVTDISARATMDAALAKLQEQNVTGLPVYGGNRKYCGVITAFDIMSHIAADYFNEDGTLVSKNVIDGLKGLPISELIGEADGADGSSAGGKNHASLLVSEPSTSLYDVLERMCHGVRHVLVRVGDMSEDGGYADVVAEPKDAVEHAIVSSTDMLRYLVEHGYTCTRTLAKKLGDLGLDLPDVQRGRSFLTVDPGTKAIHAFRMMHETGADAVAILEDGEPISPGTYVEQLQLALSNASSARSRTGSLLEPTHGQKQSIVDKTSVCTTDGAARSVSHTRENVAEVVGPLPLPTLRAPAQMERAYEAIQSAEDAAGTEGAAGKPESDWLEAQEAQLDAAMARMRTTSRAQAPAQDQPSAPAPTTTSGTVDNPPPPAAPTKRPRFAGTLTPSDLRGIRSTMFGQLQLPVLEFLSRRHHGHLPRPVSVTRDASLLTVASRALVARVHRVWVIDAITGAPTSVVRIGDMLSAIFKDIGGHPLLPREE